MRLVLDTSVVIASIRSDRGASRRLVTACLQERCTLLLSVPLALEYEAVMKREEHMIASGLSVAEVGGLLDALVVAAVPVELAFRWRPLSRDAKDDMVLETAFNGRADALVTFNLGDLAAPASRFGVRTLTPNRAMLALEVSYG